MVTHVDVDGPDSSSQPPLEVPQPQCAAAAMMHGISMAPASSLHDHGDAAHCRTPGVMTSPKWHLQGMVMIGSNDVIVPIRL